jgi:hypothetical protein
MPPAEPVFHQAIMEVRYDEGIVYLDKCGSLTRDLQRVVGRGYDFELPTVQQGELKSQSERMVVRYGPANLSVTQTGLHEVARFAQVSSWSWQQVSSALEVGRKVRRCGIRFLQLFPVETVEQADEVLVRSGLVGETELWRKRFGVATKRAFVGIVDAQGWRSIRVEIATRTLELGREPPAEMKPFMPEHSVSFDLDFLLVEERERAEVRHADLKDAIVRAWARAKEFGSFMSAELVK